MYVYAVARLNIYMPDALAYEVRGRDMNMSALAQEAARSALAQLGVTPTRGSSMESASAEQLDYIKTRLAAISAEVSALSSISESKARTVLLSVQGIADALEADRFARL
ncbi:MAG: hypothetical protein O2892_18355 [Actinomycetota bacterium]|nr:hypothetical protein [Actinomycetota bacterium]MDA2950967.1 hypothetical protein [Actinomycetota bacterium]